MAEVNKQLQAWAKQSREKEQQIRRDMQKGTWKPNAVSAAPKVTVNRDPKPVKYVGAKGYQGLAGGVSNMESAVRIAAANEISQIERSREAERKGAGRSLYQNVLGGGVDTLNSLYWDKNRSLLGNLANIGGGYLQATGEFATGLLGLEGIKNEIGKALLKRDAEKTGLSEEEQAELERQMLVNNNASRRALGVDKVQAYTERQKPLQNKVVRGAGEVAEVVGAMAPALAVGAATKNPVAAKMLMSGQVMGGKAEEALANGATLDEARRAGLLSGAVAYGTESLFRGIPLIDRNTGLAVSAAKKALPKTVVTALENYGKTQAGRNLVWLANKGGEGVEEVIEDLLDPAISSIYGDDKTITAKQLIQDFGLGTVVSLILGGAPGKVQNTTEAETVAEAPAELKTEPQKPITREEYAAAVKQFHAEMEQTRQQEAYRNAAGQTEDTKAPNVLLRGNAEQQTARPQGLSAPEILYGDRYGNPRETPDEPLLLGTAEGHTQTFDEWLNQKLKTETDPVERYRLTMLRDYAENEFLSGMGEKATADPRQANIQTPLQEMRNPITGMAENAAAAANDGTARLNIGEDEIAQAEAEAVQEKTSEPVRPINDIDLNPARMPEQKRGLLSAISGVAKDFYQSMVHSGVEIDKLDKITKNHRNRNNYNHVMQASHIAEQSLHGKDQVDLTGKRMGDSLDVIMEPVYAKGDQYVQEFQTYMRHLHNIERWKAGKGVFGTDETKGAWTAEMSDKRANELLTAHPEFKEIGDQVRKYAYNLVEIMKEGGLISEAEANKMHSVYPNYVPTGRIGKNGPYLPMKETTGGNSEMIPIFDALASYTTHVTRKALMNKLGQSMLDSAMAGNSDIARVVERKDAPKAETTMQEDENLAKEEEPTPILNGKNFTVYKDGVAYTLRLNDAAYKGMEALTKPFTMKDVIGSDAGKAWDKAMSLFKNSVTTWDPLFMAFNAVRDNAGALIYSRDLKQFMKAYPKAVEEMKNNGPLWQQYKNLGAFSLSYMDIRATQNKLNPVNKVAKKLAAPLNAVEKANSFVEQLPRFAEFIATLEKSGDYSYDGLMDAMYSAADVTVNFSRGGKTGKAINRFSAFFNAAVQGLDKAGRTFLTSEEGKPWGRILVMAAGTGILPQVLSEAVYGDDRDYQELPLREKANNYLIKMSNGKFLRIPKGRLQGVLAGLTQSATDAIQGEGGRFGDAVNLILENAAPNDPLENNLITMARRARLFNNDDPGKTWYGSNIENAGDQNNVPADRYDETTSEPIVAVTRAIDRLIPGTAHDLSPKKVQNLVETYGGVWADLLVPATTPQAERGYLESKFVRDPVYSNTLSGDFYSALDEASKADTDSFRTEEEQRTENAFSRYLSRQQAAASALYDQIDEIQNDPNKTDREKRKEVRELRKQVNDVYRDALGSGYKDAVSEIYDTAVSETAGQEEKDTRNYLYLLANRNAFGAEYALQVKDKDTYEAAKEFHEKSGVSYDAILDVELTDGSNTPTGRFDENGREITLTNSGSANRAKTIGKLDIPDEQKMALAEEYCGKGTIRALNAALDLGMDTDKAMDVWVNVSNANANGGYDTTAQALAIYHSDLPADQKKAYSDAILVRSSFGKETPTDIDYSSEETVIITSLSDTAQRKWPVAQRWNFTPEFYGRCVKVCNSESKKADQIAALETVFREEYGDRIDAAAWAQKFRALNETKAYGI